MVLSLIGLRSSFWRLHAIMGIVSVLTMYVLGQFFTDYILQENTKLATAFFDASFGALVTFLMIRFETRKNEENNSRLYLYYVIILSVFFATSMLNVIAWSLDSMHLYEGSYLESVYNKTILAANIIQLSCLIEGGFNGLRNIYYDIVNRRFVNILGYVWHKNSIQKIDEK